MGTRLACETLAQTLKRPIIFVSGKGGVGKTAVSQAIALSHSRRKKTLWIGFEDPLRPAGETQKISRSLFHMNCVADLAFEEYVGMKIKIPGLTRLFTQNKLIQFLAKAGPGIHELVLLGKLWHERHNYDQIVADMPSTGYGLAMFQSIENWSTMFRGGPLFKDAEGMLATFADPATTGQLIVSLPEEMPLQESLELDQFLSRIFPENRASFVVNRRFPAGDTCDTSPEKAPENPDTWPSPVTSSMLEYARKRYQLEKFNLRIWNDAAIQFGELPFVAPITSGRPEASANALVGILAEHLQQRGYV